MTALCDLPALQLRAAIATRGISPVELLDACIERIELVDGAVKPDTSLNTGTKTINGTAFHMIGNKISDSDFMIVT